MDKQSILRILSLLNQPLNIILRQDLSLNPCSPIITSWNRNLLTQLLSAQKLQDLADQYTPKPNGRRTQLLPLLLVINNPLNLTGRTRLKIKPVTAHKGSEIMPVNGQSGRGSSPAPTIVKKIFYPGQTTTCVTGSSHGIALNQFYDSSCTMLKLLSKHKRICDGGAADGAL
jgi:hypothetical protein